MAVKRTKRMRSGAVTFRTAAFLGVLLTADSIGGYR